MGSYTGASTSRLEPRFERVAVEPTLRTTLDAQPGEPQPTATEPATQPDDTSATINCRLFVVSELDGRAVGGAAVEIVALSADEKDRWPRILAVLGSGSTDATGRFECVFSDPQSDHFLAARVTHSGFAAKAVAIRSGLEETIHLSEGLRIAGRVVAANTDIGIPDATVCVSSVELPLEIGGEALPLFPRPAVAFANTDTGGHFSVVVPRGMYVVRAGAPQWIEKRPRPGAAERSWLAVTAGDETVRVELERYRLVRFELRDATSGRRIAQPILDLIPLDRREDVSGNGPGSLLSPTSTLTDRRWTPLSSAHQPVPGVLVGVVPGDSTKDTVRVLVTVARYRKVVAQLRLLTPDQVTAGELDSVLLQRDWAGEAGDLLVSLDAPYADELATRTPTLVASDVDGNTTSMHILVPTDGGWLVPDLPVARMQVHVSDGVQTSDEVQVDIRARERTKILIRLDPPSGISLSARTRSGEPALDIDVWALTADGRQVRPRTAMDGRPPGDLFLERRQVVHRLLPGTYELIVQKRGGAVSGSAQAVVRRGEITPVEVVLD